MKLRSLLVTTHLVSILCTAVVIGIVSLVLQHRSSRELELGKLDQSLAMAGRTLNRRVEQLQQVLGIVAGRVASGELHPNNLDDLARLHELMASFHVARVEVFRGLEVETEAFRWQRSTDRDLATVWLPPHPRIAAEVTAGRSVMWVQRGADWTRSLKILAPVQTPHGEQDRWVVVSEPLDSFLVAEVIPEGLVGALEVDQSTVAIWPGHLPAVMRGDVSHLLRQRPRNRVPDLFSHPVQRSVVLQTDDGSRIGLAAGSTTDSASRTVLLGLRIWMLITVLSLLAAAAVGGYAAGRLLGPLKILLEGTAAIGRGHLTVRLAETGSHELGALTREFNRMADEIRNTYMGLISTLAEVVEAKSHYTREHIERVERLTMLTAEALERRGWVKLSSHQRFLLSVAAVLHDVGKIAISNEILNKSGPLNDGERQQILTHPEVGALIVERMGKLERAAEIILHAHEHFDGSGYPHGLKGEEIPLGSRIILAVDAFDAMTMDRPYSNGRPMEDAVEELRSESGRQFDPVVVEALIDAVTSEQWEAGPAHPLDSGLYRVLHGGSPAVSARRTPARPE